jgi:hypothetical protein
MIGEKDLNTELVKRDNQEYLNIDSSMDNIGEQSSLQISADILPVNNPPSQSNKRIVKEADKSKSKI